MIKTVDATSLKHWMDAGDVVLVDVREPEEHASGSIQGALLMPVGQVARHKLDIAQGKKLVIHCRSGKRGGMACEKLLLEEPNLEVYNLEGGILAWVESGYY